eukprot:gene12247-biopygen12432
MRTEVHTTHMYAWGGKAIATWRETYSTRRGAHVAAPGRRNSRDARGGRPDLLVGLAGAWPNLSGSLRARFSDTSIHVAVREGAVVSALPVRRGPSFGGRLPRGRPTPRKHEHAAPVRRGRCGRSCGRHHSMGPAAGWQACQARIAGNPLCFRAMATSVERRHDLTRNTDFKATGGGWKDPESASLPAQVAGAGWAIAGTLGGASAFPVSANKEGPEAGPAPASGICSPE